jgi:hypothetical protein
MGRIDIREPMMSGQQSTEQPEGRPLGQRAIAGVLAIAMFVSGCGGAFNDSDASAQGGSVDRVAAFKESDVPTLTISVVDSEDGSVAGFDSVGVHDVTEKAPSAVQAFSCTHTVRSTLGKLSDRHMNNIRNFWTKPDESNPGQRVPLIVDSTHEHARHARAHFQNHAKDNLYTLKNHIEYRVKFNEIDYRSRTANWTKTLTFPGLSRVGCDQHKRHLTELLENKANTDIGIDFPSYVVDGFLIIMGIVATYYLAAYLAVALPVAWQPWASAFAGCGVGFVTGMGAFLKSDTLDHVMYPILGLANCAGGIAGVHGSRAGLASATHDLEEGVRAAVRGNRPVSNALSRTSSEASFFSVVSDAGEATRRRLLGAP